MNVRLLALPLAVLVGVGLMPRRAAGQRPAATLITGTVLGADGAPLTVGHVHLAPVSSSRRSADAPLAPDGGFAIATTLRGPARLTVTGVDHYPASVTLLLGDPVTIGLDVRLKHYEYADSLERITAIGDWNSFDFQSGRSLVRQSDGRWTLEVDAAADTLAYELLGLEKSGSRSINGTEADRYAYDGGGDYRSVIRARGGHATITFDPATLRRVAGDVRITFREPNAPAARMFARWRAWSDQRNAFMDSSNAARQRHDSLRYDWGPVIAERAAALDRERDPLQRQMLLLQLWEAEQFSRRLDSAVAVRVVREIPPSSPLWAFLEFGGPSSMMLPLHIAAGGKVTPRWRGDTTAVRRVLAFLDQVVAEHPDSNVQASALGSAIALAQMAGDMPRSNDYYVRLERDYPDAPDLAFLRTRYSPDRVLQAGRQIPEFRFVSLDDSSVVYSRTSMLGRTYLLDVWATWCGPCIGEMQFLHPAHDSLAADGVEFLSVSLDNRPEDVRRFREGEWKMPWLHAFAPGGWQHPEIRKLEVLGVPTTILVGPDGTILAVDPRGEHTVRDIRAALPARPAR